MRGLWNDGELGEIGSRWVYITPYKARDEGLAAAALHCGIQAAISMATGIPSQGIVLLKAQCWTTAAWSQGVRMVAPCVHRSPCSFPPQFVLGGQKGEQAS